MKKYKIFSYVTVYSKKKGAHVKGFCVEADLTLDEAKQLSHDKYGNTNKQLEWKTAGFLYPTLYKIK